MCTEPLCERRLARAARKWGCRESVLGWKCEHILPALRKHIENSSIRDIGDCWWLATLEIGGSADEMIKEEKREAGEDERDATVCP